jgi:serine/threonine protein phosphatase 1
VTVIGKPAATAAPASRAARPADVASDVGAVVRLAETDPRAQLPGVRSAVDGWFGRKPGGEIDPRTLASVRRDFFVSPQTGLPNRAAIDLVRNPGETVGVVSIPSLKHANDGIDHAFGDRVIQAFGLRLHEAKPGSAFHLGGGDFAVLLPKRTAEAELQGIANTLRYDTQVSLKNPGTGETVVYNGFNVPRGLGDTLEAANQAHLGNRAAQTARGEKPALLADPKRGITTSDITFNDRSKPSFETVTYKPDETIPPQHRDRAMTEADIAQGVQRLSGTDPETGRPVRREALSRLRDLEQGWIDEAGQLSPAERIRQTAALRAARYFDPSGLLNRTAAEELPKPKHRMFIDLDSLKAINGAMGEKGGDRMLDLFARGMRDVGEGYPGNLLFKIGGDEFEIWGDSPATLHRFAKDLTGRMNEVEFSQVVPTGEGREAGYALASKKGINFSYGLSDARMLAHKQGREARGLRPAPGSTDLPGLTVERLPPGFRPDAQGPARAAAGPGPTILSPNDLTSLRQPPDIRMQAGAETSGPAGPSLLDDLLPARSAAAGFDPRTSSVPNGKVRDPASLRVRPLTVETTPEGFRKGGVNDSGLIRTLTTLDGRPISELEALMYPGRGDKRQSVTGYLAPGSRLTDVLAADNDLVRGRGYSHQELAQTLKYLAAMEDTYGDRPIALGDRSVSVTKRQWADFQPSPFDDGTRGKKDYTVRDLATGDELVFSSLSAEMADCWGFWNDPKVLYRLDPGQVIDFLGDPRASGRAGAPDMPPAGGPRNASANPYEITSRADAGVTSLSRGPDIRAQAGAGPAHPDWNTYGLRADIAGNIGRRIDMSFGNRPEVSPYMLDRAKEFAAMITDKTGDPNRGVRQLRDLDQMIGPQLWSRAPTGQPNPDPRLPANVISYLQPSSDFYNLQFNATFPKDGLVVLAELEQIPHDLKPVAWMDFAHTIRNAASYDPAANIYCLWCNSGVPSPVARPMAMTVNDILGNPTQGYLDRIRPGTTRARIPQAVNFGGDIPKLEIIADGNWRDIIQRPGEGLQSRNDGPDIRAQAGARAADQALPANGNRMNDTRASARPWDLSSVRTVSIQSRRDAPDIRMQAGVTGGSDETPGLKPRPQRPVQLASPASPPAAGTTPTSPERSSGSDSLEANRMEPMSLGWKQEMLWQPDAVQKPTVIVPDTHGRPDLTRKLFDTIEDRLPWAVGPDTRTVLLGDYIDKGSSSARNVDYIVNRAAQPGAGEYIALAGNHENYLFRLIDKSFITTKSTGWAARGPGRGTLESYRHYGLDLKGLDMRDARKGNADGFYSELRQRFLTQVPQSHLDFFRNLKVSARIGDDFFSHAGFDGRYPLDMQRRDPLIDSKEKFWSEDIAPDLNTWHGHTVFEKPVIREWENGRFSAGLDLGAYQTGDIMGAVRRGDEIYLTILRQGEEPVIVTPQEGIARGLIERSFDPWNVIRN